MEEMDNIKVFGSHDENTLAQMKNCAKDNAVVSAVLCADGHLGYAVPIGGVLAYDYKISPSAVGFDIGCGNKAVLTDMPAREARRKIKKIMDDVWAKISFGMGRNNEEEVDHELFDDEAWKMPALRSLKQTARNQLGTVGGGVCRLAQ